MHPLSAIVLGVVQGVTEFLPISSDGHLAIVYHLLGETPDLTFEIFLHAATLLAMVVYFREDLASLAQAAFSRRPEHAHDRRLAVRVGAVTVVTGVAAIGISPAVEPANDSLAWIGAGFLVTSALMLTGEIAARHKSRTDDTDALSPVSMTLIGLLQGLAVLPGVSRSGSTISAGMFSGLSRQAAARFSFLCGIPIIALAAAKDGAGLLAGSATLPGVVPSVAGFFAAAISGYLAIAALLNIVRRHGLWVFSAYTALLGAGMLVIAART